MTLLFLGYGYLSQDIQLDFWSAEEIFTARTFPVIIAVGGVLLSVLLILNGKKVVLPGLDEITLGPLLLLVIIMLVFTVVIDELGFIVSGVLLLMLGSLALGERRWHLLIVASVPVVLGLYLLLTALDIHLEPGVLRGLL